MTSKPMGRFLRFLATLVSVATASLAILVGAALLRLYHEPLDLSAYTQDLAGALKPALGRVDLSMRAPRLVWRGFGHPLEVETHDLYLRQEGASDPIVSAPEVLFSFRFRSLLLGQLLPSTLTMTRPTLWLHLPEANASAGTSENAALDFMEETFLTPSDSKTLKRLHVTDAVLHLFQGTKAWDLPKSSFVFERKHGGLDAVVEVASREALVHAHMNFDPQAHVWGGTLRLKNISPMEVLAPLSDFEGPWQDWRTLLEGSQLRLTAQGSLSWGKTQGVMDMDIDARLDPGVLQLPVSLFEKPLVFEKAQFKTVIKGGKITISDALVTTQGAALSLKGDGVFPSPQNPKGRLTLFAGLERFPMARLSALWPEKVAVDARTWLVKNVPEGMVPRASATLMGSLVCEEASPIPCFTFESLQGEIFLEKAKLIYLPTMPIVKDLSAHAVFDHTHFDIAVERGTSQGLLLSKGRVLIKDMTGDTPHLSLKVGIEGPLGGAFDIINSPPLEALKDLPVSLKDNKGQVKGTFELAFPLKDTLESQDFTYGVDMNVTGLALRKILSQVGADLEDANAHVTIKDRLLECQAKGLINGDKGDIALQVGLKDGGQTSVKIRSLASVPGLARLGIDLTPYMTGSALLDVIFSSASQGRSTLDVTANVKDAALTYGAWVKNAQVPGTLKARVILKDGHLAAIEKASFQAPEADFALTATFGGAAHQLQTLNLTHGRLGQSQAQVQVRPGKHRELFVEVNAKTLDLAPYIATLKEPSTGDAKLGRSFELKLKADRMILGESQIIKGNTLSLAYGNERVQSLTYKGHFDEELKKFFYVDIMPRAQDGRKFRLKCENGGAFFKAFDLTRNLSKGTLKIVAEQSREDGAPWIGKAEYDEFWVKDAPLMGRLLSLAFPTGLVNFFADKGLQFDRFKAHFTLARTKLIVPQGRAHGPSLGMTLKGALSDNFETLHFEGNIYPAYFVNSAISKIPVLGQLLTGGKHEGLWGVSYTITGPRDAAKIGVNPLSAFAPGILRKLFSSDVDEDMALDDGEMDHEKVLE